MLFAAEKAIELLSYTPVKTKPMRIMWADREAASLRKSGVGNVFVKVGNKNRHLGPRL